MTKLRDHLLPIGALLFLSSLAFVNLMGLPAFEDEGTTLRWIWRTIEGGEWLQPLNDGKPFEVWPMVPVVWLGFHPLSTIRALHVLVGMIGAVLTYGLTLQLSSRWTAFISGALFAICPFVVYLQRLALTEIFLCVAGIWVLLSVIKFIESPTWSHAVVLAISLVLAAFCKFPVGFVFLAAMPLALIFMPSDERRNLLRQPVLAKLLVAYAPSAVLMLVVLTVITIQLQRGQTPAFGLGKIAEIGGNQYDIAASIGIPPITLADELVAQLSWPVVTLGLIGIVVSAIGGDWRNRWLIAMGALPMLTIGLLAKNWYPRYLLFTLPQLVISAVLGWQILLRYVTRFKRIVAAAVLVVCVVLMGYQSALLIFDPSAARWSALDHFQYVTGGPSGYGYPEAARYVLSSLDPPPVIYSLDGHSAYQLRTYLPTEWTNRVRPIFYAPDRKALPSGQARLDNLLRQTPVWIIVLEPLLQLNLDSNFGRENLGRIAMRRVAVFDKPGSRAQVAIYEITRQ